MNGARRPRAAAAQILMQEGRFKGPTPPLTAAEALDLDEVVAMLAERQGRPVARDVICDEEQGRRLAKRGAPPVVPEILLGMFRAVQAGDFAAVDPTPAELLGRKPTPQRDRLAA